VIFRSLFSAPGTSNSYLLGPDDGGEAVLVDPGAFDTPLLQAVEGSRLTVRWILVTHAHSAHIRGIRTLLKIYDAEILACRPSVLDFPVRRIQDGDELALGQFRISVLETPGHSLDSVCFRMENLVFTGDTLTAGGIGVTRDGYARGLILASLRKKILPLPEETILFPGHGPPSRLWIEKGFNPYLGDTL
jgi:glyoxylase-like metal-dependent hydrolase (beta-lactamase superfamily II)